MHRAATAGASWALTCTRTRCSATRGRACAIARLAEDPDKKPPIAVKFEIPYFTTSGIQVRYLKIIEKSGYQALPWVRYITQNGGKRGARRRPWRSPGGLSLPPLTHVATNV